MMKKETLISIINKNPCVDFKELLEIIAAEQEEINKDFEKKKNKDLAVVLNLCRKYISDRIGGIYEDTVIADRLIASGVLKENSKLSLKEVEELKYNTREEVKLLIRIQNHIQDVIREYDIY